MADATVTTPGRAPARPGAAPTRDARSRRRRWLPSYATRDQLTGDPFIAPQFVGIVLFVLVPLVLIFWYSVQRVERARRHLHASSAPRTTRSSWPTRSSRAVLRATGIFSAGLVVLNLGLALLLAVLLNQSACAASRCSAPSSLSPVVVSLVAWTIVWGFLLQDDGRIDGVLQLVTMRPNLLREGPTAMARVIIVQVFKNVSLNIMLSLAALQGVPRSYTRPPSSTARSARSIFGRITLPLILADDPAHHDHHDRGLPAGVGADRVSPRAGPASRRTCSSYSLFQVAFEFDRVGYGSALALTAVRAGAGCSRYVQWQLRQRGSSMKTSRAAVPALRGALFVRRALPAIPCRSFSDLVDGDLVSEADRRDLRLPAGRSGRRTRSDWGVWRGLHTSSRFFSSIGTAMYIAVVVTAGTMACRVAGRLRLRPDPVSRGQTRCSSWCWSACSCRRR